MLILKEKGTRVGGVYGSICGLVMPLHICNLRLIL